MSLHISHDPPYKREKQEMFKKSLDDQRRIKQESASHKQDILSHGPPGSSRNVAGLDKPEFKALPGLDHRERFEGAPFARKKQPYMSALSEMNGRSLQVRQQQFEKESRYRDMLMEQIEENKRRKEAEKAKLEEEKHRELEEIRRLQAISAPRRPQLAQFQESPEHPLHSLGGVPQMPHPLECLSSRHQDMTLREDLGYDPEGRTAPVHGCLSQHYERMSTGNNQSGDGRDGRAREEKEMSSSRLLHDGVSHYRGSSSAKPQTHGVASPGQIAGLDRLQAGMRGHYDDSMGNRRRGRGGLEKEPREATGSNFVETERLMEDISANEKPALEWRGSGAIGDPDVVSRSDFDELSNLCRDLLLEQKHLRRRLEDCEERDPRAERMRQRSFRSGAIERGESRRRGSGQVASERPSAGGVRRRRVQLAVGGEIRAPGNCVQEAGLRRDRSKPGVAFGSTVPRSGQARTADKLRGTMGSTQEPRNGRDPRIGKSEPFPRPDILGDRDNSARRITSTKVREPFANRRPLDSEWRNLRRTAHDLLTGQDESLGRLAPHEDRGGYGHGHRAQTSGTGEEGNMHGLLSRSPGAQFSSRYETGECDELGGESTFLSRGQF